MVCVFVGGGGYVFVVYVCKVYMYVLGVVYIYGVCVCAGGCVCVIM